MIFDVMRSAGHSVNGITRISANNVSVVSIEFSKCFLKNGNPEAAVGANVSKNGLIVASLRIAYERKVIINDYSVRHTE